jgi:uncharacterized membrane protein YjfL (UPF0719 family)
MENLISPYLVLFGISYFIIGILLFVLNLYFFEKATPFSVKEEVFGTQNKALGLIVRGQLLGQWIMISTLIYFLGVGYDHNFSLNIFLGSMLSIVSFGLVGIALFQGSLYIIGKVIPLEKEIIIDNNEALGSIIEGFLIAIALILSVSLYSY